MADPLDLYEAAPVSPGLLRQYRPVGPEPSTWLGAAARSAARSAVPTAAGVAGFGAGAAIGAPLAPVTFGLAPIVTGLIGATGAGYLADKAQSEAADYLSDGGFTRGLERDEAEHPYATMAGTALPQLAFMRPSRALALLPRAVGAAVGGGVEAGSELAHDGRIDPLRVGEQATIGGLLDSETGLGKLAMGAGRGLVIGPARRVGATAARLGARSIVAGAIADIAEVPSGGAVSRAAIDALDPNLSAETRGDLARVQTMRAHYGDRLTPDEIAATAVIEQAAHTEASNPLTPTPEHRAAFEDAVDGAHAALAAGEPIAVPDRSPVETHQLPRLDFDRLAWAVRQVESGGNQFAVSKRGAKGAMQVMDATARDPGFGVAPARDDSLAERDRVGHDLLQAFVRRYDSELLGTAAYNAGPANVDRWIARFGDPRTGATTAARWSERIPFRETRDYVGRVFGKAGEPLPRTPLLRPELFADDVPSQPNVEAGAYPDIFPDDGNPDWGHLVGAMSFTETGRKGALWHPDVGEIDVPWGEAGSGASDGHGLAKLVEFHPEVVKDLPDIVASMDVIERGANRIRLASADHDGVVSLEWNGEPRRPWLLTAYDKNASRSTNVGRVDADGRDGHFPGRETIDDIAARTIDVKPETLTALADYVRTTTRSLKPEKVARALGVERAEAHAAIGRLAARGDGGLRVSRRGTVMRIAKRDGPVDLVTFLAEHGGIRDDEGHSLRRGRNMDTLVRGVGPLIRRTGMSIDEAGELLHEHGFVHGDRPTEADVLDLLDRASFEKVWRPEDAAEITLARENERYERLDRYSDPEGDGPDAQADSIEHDLRGAVEADPALAVQLGDAAEPVRAADLLDALDGERDGLDALGACATPRRGDG